VNPIYAIMESPYRWLILAGLSFLAALLGTMVMLSQGWSHWLERVWFLAALALALYFLVQALLEWNAGGPDLADGQRLTEFHTDGEIG
jgi:hypothetical protein